jgi:IS30 family transposase
MTETVVSALIKQSKNLPDELYKSLTWDRGTELADHLRFTLATNMSYWYELLGHTLYSDENQ